ncbi:MAG: ABC-F type ribosomal protection protein [Oscillospiraceae bacterium]|nr:ABC-F type ribosomal protection protein [Oscillospiraceae bacterium]
MSVINVANLTFGYESSSENIFENVSFSIDTDWKLGFIGRNGRGKTTFLRILTGELEYSGNISADVEFEYFPYDVTDESEYTIDIIRTISCDVQDWEIYREISLLSLSDDVLYREFHTLSNGEKTKALLAAMFLKQNTFLLIDEPTNHLDSAGRKKLAEYLCKKKGFILVSHDRTFLDRCIDHVLSINRQNIEIQKGNFSSWQQNKDFQDSFELAQNENLKKNIKRLEMSAKRTSEWSDTTEKSKRGTRNSGLRPDRGFIGHKSAKMMKRSKSIEKRQQSAIEEKSALLKNIEASEELKMSFPQFHSQRLISVNDLSISYDGRTIFSDVSFDINRGDRAALCGGNGSGKSSVLKLLCGENIQYSGGFYKPEQLKISYVPQNVSGICGTPEEFALKNNIDFSLFLTLLRKLGFEREQFERRLEDFSEGQKKKAVIAASLCTGAHLYIWDEPLNYIDVISRMQIEEVILKYAPTMIFVEHDEYFCDKISNKIISL